MKKLKIWQIVLIVILALGVIGALFGNDDDNESEKNKPKNELAIEWDEETKTGKVIFDVELPNGYVPDWVVLNYYKAIASSLKNLDKDTLREDYENILFVGLVKDEEDNVRGQIRGNLSIDFIQKYKNFSKGSAPLDIKENIEELFIPEFLEEK